MSDKEEDLSENEKLAEEHYAKAREALGAVLQPEEAREASALKSFVEAFNLTHRPACMLHIFRLCIKRRISILNIGLEEGLMREALNDEALKSYILDFLAKKMEIINDIREQNPDHEKAPQIYLPDLEILEIYKKSDPNPRVLTMLYLYYQEIGRIKDAYNAILEAALKKPETCGRIFIAFSFKYGRYREIVEFYEHKQEALDGALEVEDVRRVATAYENLFKELTQDGTVLLEDEEEFEMCHGLLRKSDALYRKNYEAHQEEYAGDEQPTKDGMIHVMNYALSFNHQASFLDFNRNAGHEVADTTELRRHSIQIYKNVITRIGERANFEHWNSTANQAKLQMMSASLDENLGLDTIEESLEIARSLYDYCESGELKDAHVFYNNLAQLLRIKRRLTGNQESLAEEEDLLLKSLWHNWRGAVSYTALIGYYNEIGDPHKMQLLRVYLVSSQLLALLVDLDKMHIDIGELEISDHVKGPEIDFSKGVDEYQKSFHKRREEMEKHMIPLDAYFEPYFKAFEAYAVEYEKYLESIAPEGSEIYGRIKGAYSVLLKMLKEGKQSIARITDLMGFTVLTDTKEQARELYNRVKNDMSQEYTPKEFLTLDEPTSTFYRSLDITGLTGDGKAIVQVQIRTKEIDREIKASRADHDYYKITSGKKLDEEVDNNPEKYLELMHIIMGRLGEGYKKLSELKGAEKLNPLETLDIYNKAIPSGFKIKPKDGE